MAWKLKGKALRFLANNVIYELVYILGSHVLEPNRSRPLPGVETSAPYAYKKTYWLIQLFSLDTTFKLVH